MLRMPYLGCGLIPQLLGSRVTSSAVLSPCRAFRPRDLVSVSQEMVDLFHCSIPFYELFSVLSDIRVSNKELYCI